MKGLVSLFVAVLIPQVSGFLGSLATTPKISGWYAGLNKPGFNPPSWVFAPVWGLLFLLMGIASWLVWKEGWRKSEVRVALVFYGIQLVLNVLWSVIFFGMQNPGLALVDMVILLGLIIWTSLKFFGVSKLSGRLMIPYVLWVSFASILNVSIFLLNR